MILVTGATGNVGREVVNLLRALQAPLRIGARRPATTPASPPGDVVAFDFLDVNTYAAAVHGCQSLFLLRPPAVANTRKTLIPLIDAARAAGVQQVVFVSVAGAGENPVVPHHAVEQHLRQGPPGWTILRPGFFAQNLGDAYCADIVADDRLYVPAGAGRAAFVDVRDVAAVAADALLTPASHQGEIYTLTGPAALSFTAVAEILTNELERTIRYTSASIPSYFFHLRRRGMPLAQIIVQTILHVGLRFGQAEAVDPALTQLLSRPPHTLQEYVRDHRGLWRKPLLYADDVTAVP